MQGGIVVVKADGSGLRELTDSGGEDVWSPEVRSIAFTSGRDGNAEIYVIDADGGDQRNVSKSPAQDVGPAWSPRG